ncbi:EXS-domain-containing protein [Basidiobolus meristosporus CBS 931.73]|uniref:EXS-domain-containing protein n=1 Tax=Basidiobolus meristosporus CBS 931.73 TaxID=1314790 RepID=A0A1Y1XAS2_9FUNG|nr:EXS-domain-containing protein [Basidiobolus meristosporus CBS 931.73]|eukprot:ORX82852.1 EXS-domain-containing protein [Basidiobolus meristosporus CBS 931.73]
MADSYVPFEYRALLLIDLGLWCWGLNIQLLNKAGIDVPTLFGFEKHENKVHGVVYRIALAFSLITLAFLSLFCSLLRIIVSPIRSEPSFGDVILADILTSFAKVFAGIYFTFCAFFTASNSDAISSDYLHHSLELLIIGPLITSLPFLFRFRQCISEYLASEGTGYKALANAVKYASAFPVIFLSALIHSPSQEASHMVTIWLLTVLFNSLYSFYWDVVMDWGLSVSCSPEKKSGMIVLRHILLYREPVYYISILVDFFLRTTWSLKLSENLKSEDLISGGFLLEAAEILRRWLWVYFRVEKEWIGFGFNGLHSNDSLDRVEEQEIHLITHERAHLPQ